MEQITIQDLTFSYGISDAFALQQISFSVEKGSIVLLIGKSGCGKTTLLRHLKPELMPAGMRSESFCYKIDGVSYQDLEPEQYAKKIGFVGQNPEAAIATDKVWHELAFGLESLGYSQEVMQRKIAEIVAFFGLENIYHEKMCNLSGGQKQMVLLASMMVMEPEILILDEPTSQLDPIAAAEFLSMLARINRELGVTVIMTEHRMEEVLSMCDRVLLLDMGHLVYDATPRDMVTYLHDELHTMFLAMPNASKLCLELDQQCQELPVNVKEGSKWFSDWSQGTSFVQNFEDEKLSAVNNEYALQAKELWFRYDRKGADVLKDCDLQLAKGSITAILGGNGTGKSTLLKVLAGRAQPYQGKVVTNGSIGYMPQNPQAMFAEKTVEEELRVACKASAGDAEIDLRVTEVVHRCDLQAHLHKHPFDLSGGEMQRLAMAILLLQDADILMLDEPGKGMDYTSKSQMGEMLLALAAQGKTILFVSHDVEFAAQYADVCGMFFDGHLLSLVSKRRFFEDNLFYTTTIRRMCKQILPHALLLEDVLQACRMEGVGKKGRNEKDAMRKESAFCGNASEETNSENVKESRNEQSLHVTTTTDFKPNFWITAFVFLVCMPATIYMGNVLLHQRKYYFIALLILLEGIGAFFLSFEKRKPKLREIMIVATLAAIAVVGRGAFYMLPSVKPMAAIVILSGVSLGGEVGFLVGAMSMLVSNIFFGQGPWTPWQMFAMGMLGFVAGLLFRRKLDTSWKRIVLIAIAGFVLVMILYGGIMNPASVLMYQEHVNKQMIVAAYLAGVPFDLVHALSTFVFILIGGKPLLEKLDRVIANLS